MPIVQDRNVRAEALAALERRAVRRERSQEGELRHVLAPLAREEPPAGPLPPLDLKLAAASPESTWRREEIYDDHGR
jgi:plasmid stability protein